MSKFLMQPTSKNDNISKSKNWVEKELDPEFLVRKWSNLIPTKVSKALPVCFSDECKIEVKFTAKFQKMYNSKIKKLLDSITEL